MWPYAVILGIMVSVGYWVFHPLSRPKPFESVSPQRGGDPRKALQQAKEDVYAAIKEMDFDYGMGKISEDDYQLLKSQYKAKALEIFKELDTVEGGDGIDAAIEGEVQQLRADREQKRQRGKDKETGWQINFCPQCGKKVALKNNFCQGCGVRLVPPRRRD